jgi:hypothetical protein
VRRVVYADTCLALDRAAKTRRVAAYSISRSGLIPQSALIASSK